MRQRVVLIVLAGLNVAFAVGFVVALRHASAGVDSGSANAQQAGAGPERTRVVARKQFFSWQEVESTDYPTYLKNLRDIECPEQTIRDIIIADVNQLYARKRLTEIVTADQQWWRSDPDVALEQAAAAKAKELDQERRGLLTTLLGPDWEANTMALPPRPGIVFNGPVLGELSPEVKQAVLEISTRSQQRTVAYLQAQARAGKTLDPAVLAQFRLDARNELSKVLNTTQLEEYLLRYSSDAAALRKTLHGFDVTPAEFRKIFRLTDPLDQQIALNYSGDSQTTQQARATLEKQREQAIKNALGPERYQQLRMAQDPAYRDAVLAVQQVGGSEDALTNLYALNQALAQEFDLIRNDPDLTPEEKAQELKAAQDQQKAARDQLLGLTPPPAPPPTPPALPVHAYVPGETIDGIANNFGISPDALRAANPDVDFSRLARGAQIRIPIPQGTGQ
jgi:LysM repeat protein